MILTVNTKENTKNYDFSCENCGLTVGKRTKEWCDYAGYSDQKWKPKFIVRCDRCHQIHFTHLMREIDKEFYRKMEESTQNNVSQPVEQSVNINWSEIDTLISDRKLKLADYAKTLNMAVNEFRQAVVDHYGSRVVFRRGRGGGVMFNDQASNE
jgi:hypothetical protein